MKFIPLTIKLGVVSLETFVQTEATDQMVREEAARTLAVTISHPQPFYINTTLDFDDFRIVRESGRICFELEPGA